VRHDEGVDRAEALVASTSEDSSRRAASATVLAETINDETEPVVLRLLLDPADTAVVQAAAEALLARRDDTGVRLFCTAYSLADDELGDHLNDSLLAVQWQPENVRLLRDAAKSGTPGASTALRWLGLA
jgi:HEAT repeat protein